MINFIPKKESLFVDFDGIIKKMYKKRLPQGRFFCTFILKWLCILFVSPYLGMAERVANDFKSDSPEHNRRP